MGVKTDVRHDDPGLNTDAMEGKRCLLTRIPLLQNDLVLLLPGVFKIGGELVPNGEEGVGRNLFLAALGLDREEDAQLQEPATQTGVFREFLTEGTERLGTKIRFFFFLPL